MLIDEADIYLEIRSTGDLQRSSLVSGAHDGSFGRFTTDIS